MAMPAVLVMPPGGLLTGPWDSPRGGGGHWEALVR